MLLDTINKPKTI